ncbi:hypothetical protein PVL29_001057 [Vitis rotundifolia]|uniref:Uncharacterized protein n=1 Tax=Vitis rotundifolia TaxID=103349 RepID=A0AA39ALI8_VITRO|nr:hypothetical protein PVL29_001057 [Vitis rotundifolia]
MQLDAAVFKIEEQANGSQSGLSWLSSENRTLLKLDMVKASIIDNCLGAPSSLCSSVAELFRTLTYNSEISKGLAAARIMETLFYGFALPRFQHVGTAYCFASSCKYLGALTRTTEL